MVLISRYLVPKGYHGITLFPFIILKNYKMKSNAVLINHEKIHLQQQLELLIIPFYIIYSVEFVIHLIRFRNWHNAYRHISFEREAFENEKNLDYLVSKPFWSFLRFF